MTEPTFSRRRWLIAAAATAGAAGAARAQNDKGPASGSRIATAPVARQPLLMLDGKLIQGGAIVGRLDDVKPVRLDGELVPVGPDGAFVAGFDRDAPPIARLVIGEGAAAIGVELPVAARSYATGETISTTRSLGGGAGGDSPLDELVFDEADLEALIDAELRSQPSATRSLGGALNRESFADRIRREVELKTRALASRAEIAGFLDGFIWPLAGDIRVTSEWGTARSYAVDGSAKPHYGVDLAARVGDPVRAPAGALVTLAEADLYYEGGCVFLDHGLGLTSIYLHMSEVEVAAGDLIAQGASLGKAGAGGRATGPHLCWRLYWRDRKLDPTLLVA